MPVGMTDHHEVIRGGEDHPVVRVVPAAGLRQGGSLSPPPDAAIEGCNRCLWAVGNKQTTQSIGNSKPFRRAYQPLSASRRGDSQGSKVPDSSPHQL